MAGRFTVIPQDTFEGLQLDAGVLLNTFDPTAPAAPADADIICATTGGLNITCVPTYSDFGEDVDNCPNNMLELKHLDGWECGISTTALGVSAEAIHYALGAADSGTATDTYVLSTDASVVSGKTYYTLSGSTYSEVSSPTDNPSSSSYYEKGTMTSVIPRAKVNTTDFDSSVWWVGDKADGGLVAVQLKNVLSTGGFSLQTTKNGKGQLSLELMGHVSISAQDVVPMAFYSMDM